jgi:hypothetical protein
MNNPMTLSANNRQTTTLATSKVISSTYIITHDLTIKHTIITG